VAQRGANARREAEEAAAAGVIATEAEAQRTRAIAQATAEATRLTGEAQGDAEAAHLAAYRDLPEAVLMSLALKELAGNLPMIESLVLTPDLVTKALAGLRLQEKAQ
jgi:regulator of protease activity HflC (stomatin/prohibitin superfamily)